MLSTEGNSTHLTQVDSGIGTCWDFEEFIAGNELEQQTVKRTMEDQLRIPPPLVVERNTRTVKTRYPLEQLNL